MIVLELFKIGSDITGISEGNFSAVRKSFRHELSDGQLKLFMSHPKFRSSKAFSLLRCCAYIEKCLRTTIFLQRRPSSFNHEKILEPPKATRKLTQKVLHQFSLKRSPVKIANAFFHSGAIAALKHLPKLKGSVTFFRLVRRPGTSPMSKHSHPTSI